jgi:hypothetical protein
LNLYTGFASRDKRHLGLTIALPGWEAPSGSTASRGSFVDPGQLGAHEVEWRC